MSTCKARRRSPIWRMSANDFSKVISESQSFSEVIRTFGFGTAGNNSSTVKQRCMEEGISTGHFRGNEICLLTLKKEATPWDLVLVADSTYSRRSLKRRLLDEAILKNKCNVCGFSGEWNGKPLKLILDHINGIPNDNRIGNLQIVCPNCNSQLETFTGKNNRRRKPRNCSECGRKIFHRSTKCRKCSNKGRFGKTRHVEWPQYEDLVKEIEETNRCIVARRLGVSETAVRKMLVRMEKHNV